MNIPVVGPKVIKIENGGQDERERLAYADTERRIESFIIADTETENSGLHEATRRQMNFVKNQFEGWYEAIQVQLGKTVHELGKSELASVLKKYYLTARKKDGSSYKLCSFLIIRRCLSLIFQHDYGITSIDITADPEFMEANIAFNEMTSSLRGLEESKSGVNEAWRLTPSKLIKLYTEGQLDFYNTPNPKILLQTAFFYICYYTGVGKLSVMKKITMGDVEEVLENNNVIAYNFHLRQYLPNEKAQGPFTINQIPGKPWCPVLTIQQYLSHRNSYGQCFFQKPFPRSQCLGSNIWYKKCRFKDFFPLTNMCREASIDPPLNSGCFNKQRISAEIRFEMTAVYSKLFPGYFKNGSERNTAPQATRRKRPIKILPNHSTDQQLAKPVEVTDLTKETVETLQRPVQATTSVGIRRNIQTSTSTASQSKPDTGIRHKEASPAQNTEQISNNHPHSMHDKSPTVTVGKVFSYYPGLDGLHINADQNPSTTLCDATYTVSDRPTMVEHNVSDRFRSPMAVPASNQNIESSNMPAQQYHASSSVNLTPNPVPQPSNSPAGFSIPSSSQYHQQSPVHLNTHTLQQCSPRLTPQSSEQMSAYTASQSTESYTLKQRLVPQETLQFEPAKKKSRFDGSNYTFLQHISASAREQGKGAVMLLLSLLDDLSDNNGKELLKDILQEMKII